MKIETEKGYKKSYIKKNIWVNQSNMLSKSCDKDNLIERKLKKIMKLFFFKINNVEGWNKKSAKKNKNKVNLC
jgi:hypothetical protein